MQKIIRQIPLLLLLLSITIFLGASSESLTTRVQFLQANTCPNQAQLPRLRAISNIRNTQSCIVECAASVECSALHVNLSSSSCFIARQRAEWTEAWTPNLSDPNCVGLVPNRNIISASIANGAFVFYNFRYSAINQVNKETYQAKLVNTERTLSGLPLTSDNQRAEFTVAFGMENVKHSAGFFSIFMKAYRESKGTTQYFRASDGYNDIVYFKETNRRLVFGHRGISSNPFRTIESILPATDELISIGFTCLSSTSCQAYYSNAMHAAEIQSTIALLSGSGTVATLGLKTPGLTNNDALTGRIVCFGIWQRPLTLNEFKELELDC